MAFKLKITVGDELIDEQIMNYEELCDEVNQYLEELTIGDVITGEPINIKIELLGDADGS